MNYLSWDSVLVMPFAPDRYTEDGQKYIPMPTSCCNPAPRGMSVFYVKIEI